MADHKRMKKRGRSKLFTSCFRSFAADERPMSYRKSDSRSFNNGRVRRRNLVAIAGRKEEENVVVVRDVGVVDDRSHERSSCGGGLARLLKAVLFDSVMVKKICSSSKPSISSDTCESFQSLDKTCNPSDDINTSAKEQTDNEDSSSRCSYLLSSSSRNTSTSSYSSSSSSSTNSNSRWLSEPKTSSSPTDLADINHPTSSTSSSLQKPIRSSSLTDHDTSISTPLAKSNSIPQSSSHYNGLSQPDSFDSSNSVTSDTIKSNLNIRWCLFLLLSLVVLVMYGRIYSILCTSMWFYLMPCRRVKRVNSVTNTSRLMDTESEEYKKRVIMAGLLDRTRNPLR